jgi:hypothetical protein
MACVAAARTMLQIVAVAVAAVASARTHAQAPQPPTLREAPAAGAPSIRLAGLPDGRAGHAYPPVPLVEGGTAPYQIEVRGLPTGMWVSAAGDLLGTPKRPGDYQLHVVASDSAAPPQTMRSAFLLKIHPR